MDARCRKDGRAKACRAKADRAKDGRVRTRPEFRFRSGSGRIWAGTDSGPVPVDLAGTRLVPRFFSCWIKVAKRTVAWGWQALQHSVNRGFTALIYIIKSENVEMLFFMKYNSRYLNFRYRMLNHI